MMLPRLEPIWPQLARSVVAAVVTYVAAVAIMPATALAQESDFYLSRGRPAERTYFPKWGAEIRMSPYRPALSNNPRVKDLYAAEFLGQHDSSTIKGKPLMYSLELDWYPWQIAGLWGIYGRIGYWSVSGKAVRCQSETDCTSDTFDTTKPGNDSAAMTILPVSVGGLYRFDYLRRRFDLPIIPSVKAGADFYYWSGKIGDQTSRYLNPHAKGFNRYARGYNVGVSAAVQLSIGLDIFRSTRSGYGRRPNLQNNYLFVEYMLVHGKNLFPPAKKRPDMSPVSSWLLTVGFAFDFS